MQFSSKIIQLIRLVCDLNYHPKSDRLLARERQRVAELFLPSNLGPSIYFYTLPPWVLLGDDDDKELLETCVSSTVSVCDWRRRLGRPKMNGL